MKKFCPMNLNWGTTCVGHSEDGMSLHQLNRVYIYRDILTDVEIILIVNLASYRN